MALKPHLPTTSSPILTDRVQGGKPEYGSGFTDTGRRQPLGETVCAVQGMYKGLQVSAVTAIVRGSLGVGYRMGGLLFFLPYLLM